MGMNVNRRAMLLGAGAVSLAAMGVGAWTMAARAAAGKAVIGTWGVDLAAMDKSVAPGDDFFRHVGGTWMKKTAIPSDRSRWGSFNILAAKSEDDVRTVLDEARRKSPAAGSVERKAVDYYESFNDTATIQSKGLTPAKPDLDRIAAVQTHEDLVALLAGPEFRANSPIGMGVNLDAKRPDTYVIGVGQAGLGHLGGPSHGKLYCATGLTHRRDQLAQTGRRPVSSKVSTPRQRGWCERRRSAKNCRTRRPSRTTALNKDGRPLPNYDLSRSRRLCRLALRSAPASSRHWLQHAA